MRTYFLFLALTANYCFAQNWALKGTLDHRPFHEGLAVFYDTEKHLDGVINTSGEIVIPAKYKGISNFDAGMAVVTTSDGKKGIIDRHDNFILQPIYKDFYPEEKASGMYIVVSDDGKNGLFFNGRMVLPVEYKSVYTWNYPFIEYIDQNDVHQTLNMTTGNIADDMITQGTIAICKKNGIRYYFDKMTGERIDSTTLKSSSQGIIAFQDEVSKRYGFKNKNTGAIIIEPKHQRIGYGIWISDMMIVTDSINSEITNKCTLVDCYGKEHNLCETGKEYMYVLGDYVVVGIEKDGKTFSSLYTAQGEQLLPMTKTILNIIEGEKDWIGLWEKPYQIFDAKKRVMYPGSVFGRHEGVFSVHNDTISYYINAVTRKKIKGEYYSIKDFSEGLGRVKFSNDYYDVGFVDKNGKVVLRGSKKLQLDEAFSEGVVGAHNNADDYKESFYGYIYNPLGHSGYSYNASDKMAVDRFILARWNELASEAFEKKQYGKAKDYYYKVMMNKPDEVEAILNYGSCLNNLGYYDEAIECFQLALDIDPSYELAQKNLDISLENKKIREEEEEEEEIERQERASEKSNTFWDALGNFANVLGNLSGATNMYQSYSSFSSNNHNSYSGGGSANYQSQYDMWARRAESNYNSLTNLGYSATSKKGNKSGGTLQSMSGGNYVQMKKNLRDAQREMQRIRHTAARNGVTIQQSPWETASVRY